MKRIVALGFALVFLLVNSPTDAIAAPGDDLHRLFEEYWDHEMEINPFAATSSGIKLFNDRVPDVSPASQERVLRRGYASKGARRCL